MKLYYYSGYSNPELINPKDIKLVSNYLGDITDDFKEAFEYYTNNWDISDLVENQPLFSNYSIWINPKLEQLVQFNKGVCLPPMQYLENFEGGR